MVFGLEHIGKFFDTIYRAYIGYSLVLSISLAFIVFIALNVLLVLFYIRIIVTIPLIVNKIKEILAKIEAWVG